jgi:hypothetical protein
MMHLPHIPSLSILRRQLFCLSHAGAAGCFRRRSKPNWLTFSKLEAFLP